MKTAREKKAFPNVFKLFIIQLFKSGGKFEKKLAKEERNTQWRKEGKEKEEEKAS